MAILLFFLEISQEIGHNDPLFDPVEVWGQEGGQETIGTASGAQAKRPATNLLLEKLCTDGTRPRKSRNRLLKGCPKRKCQRKSKNRPLRKTKSRRPAGSAPSRGGRDAQIRLHEGPRRGCPPFRLKEPFKRDVFALACALPWPGAHCGAPFSAGPRGVAGEGRCEAWAVVTGLPPLQPELLPPDIPEAEGIAGTSAVNFSPHAGAVLEHALQQKSCAPPFRLWFCVWPQILSYYCQWPSSFGRLFATVAETAVPTKGSNARTID